MISVSSTELLPVAEVILCLRENIQMSGIHDAVKKRLVLLASGESNPKGPFRPALTTPFTPIEIPIICG